ncbi:MAG: hydantoinase B/oxoprolinase family protein [Clostridia bacterium]|nr:hydantoinase B/oxoprolinase family protein [Clostridia bacterium]
MTGPGDNSKRIGGSHVGAGGGSIDPVTFAVLHNSLKSVVDEMNLTMFRSAYSAVITEGRDIGGAVFDARGRLVAQGESDLAVFVTMLEFSCRAILERYRGDIRPQDAFILNDPFVGGTHFNDVGIIKPVFWQDELVALVAIVGHWPDVGGSEPGSFAPDATEYYREGLRIPPIKIVRQGKLDEGVYQLILANVRIPEEREGDIRAQLGAATVGEKRLLRLIEKYGKDTFVQCMDEAINYSERLLQQEFAAMPDGEYRWTEYLDQESPANPEPVKVHLTLRIRGDQAVFDFTGSDPQTRSAANSTYSGTASAVFVATKSLFPDIPMNHGCFEPIRFVMPEGTVVNAKPPAALSAMAATVYERVIGVTFGALAQAVPDKVMACPNGLINLTIGGFDPAANRYYVAYLFSEGGFGGRATKDGSSGLVSLYGGGARITPVEVFERKYPLLFKQWQLRPDSGGPGKYRGGLGSTKTFMLTRGEARLTALGDRERFPAWGLFGGGSADKQGLVLNYGKDNQKNISLKAVGYVIREGDEVTVFGGAGGGYGDPLERDPEAVLEDVREEYVSIQHAAEAYGVIIDPDTMTVNVPATNRLRAELRQKRLGGGQL